MAGAAFGLALAGNRVEAQELTFDRFSVVVIGSGPNVIFVPGLTCSRDVWNGVVAGLRGRYRIHLVQVAGFAGEPARGNSRGEVVGGVAEGLARYIAIQSIKDAAIIGHSMGGTVAMMVAARHPQALGKAMVVDMIPDLAVPTVGQGASPQRVEAAANAIGEAMERSSDAEYEAALRSRIDGMVLTPAARPEIVRQGLASDRAVTARVMRELIETDLRPELPRIIVPVTVVTAWNAGMAHTATESDSAMKAAYAGLHGVRLVRIDDSAHFIMLDQPARFESEVLAFLAA